MKIRTDELLVQKNLVRSRSQAADLIKRGLVRVNGGLIKKAGYMVAEDSKVKLAKTEQLVSRAGEKLASVKSELKISFSGKTVLDVGSSTGGFTDLALQNGAKKVLAVDVGTDQLHPNLRQDSRVQLFEQTDIRDFVLPQKTSIDLIVIDVSFISLRQILPKILDFCSEKTQVITLVKPQFEVGGDKKHKGVIKNERMRRDIMKEFEAWVSDCFVIVDKRDSQLSGSQGNQERFYKLTPLKKLLK